MCLWSSVYNKKKILSFALQFWFWNYKITQTSAGIWQVGFDWVAPTYVCTRMVQILGWLAQILSLSSCYFARHSVLITEVTWMSCITALSIVEFVLSLVMFIEIYYSHISIGSLLNRGLSSKYSRCALRWLMVWHQPTSTSSVWKVGEPLDHQIISWHHIGVQAIKDQIWWPVLFFMQSPPWMPYPSTSERLSRF
jgi:hypothetical protein